MRCTKRSCEAREEAGGTHGGEDDFIHERRELDYAAGMRAEHNGAPSHGPKTRTITCESRGTPSLSEALLPHAILTAGIRSPAADARRLHDAHRELAVSRRHLCLRALLQHTPQHGAS